jgi:sialate O-acetylesterase
VKLAPIFGSDMVLQCDRPVPVWGTAQPGEKITIQFAGQTKTTSAGPDGKWRADLTALKTNATPQSFTVSGSSTIELTNVLVGEVWVCSGQSNMDWKLPESQNGAEATAAASHPNLRLFFVPRRMRPPGNQLDGSLWRTCTPDSVKMFSAVAYYFGREMQEKLDVPVGIIHSSWGGTPAEAWTPIEYLNSNDELRPILEREKAYAAERPKAQAEYDATLKKWTEESAKARAEGRTPTSRPVQPDSTRLNWVPASLWSGMLEPAVPFTIRGFLWYQGESNADRAQQYRTLLPTMIKSWRDKWDQPDLPFGIVQLPNYHAPSTQPDDTDWSHLRDAQLHTFKTIPNTGLIVTIDLGDPDDIHPKNKLDVGNRAARWALESVYGKPAGGKSGPIYSSSKVNGSKVVVTFNEAGDGLAVHDGGQLNEFEVAGTDKVWYWASAKIVGKDQVEVWSNEVASPSAVRYAWNSDPVHPNLTNSTGLPASPFRTDDWPGPTDGKR